MHTVKVFNENGKIVPTKVLIDDKPLVGCCAIDYHADISSAPMVTFEILSLADIEVNHADICFKFHPKSVEDAVKILRHDALTGGSIRQELLKRIEDTLKDVPKDIGLYDIAEIILQRIIGQR